MTKDKTILELINKLKVKTNLNLVEIIDYWEGDLCAIGIKRHNKLAYICTYDLSQGREDGYDFDLEILDPVRIDKLHVVKEGRNVDETTLITEISSFLDI